MAKKLTDDHIKWVLDLDAKGVQGELTKLSSVTQQYTDDNKRLRAEMREAEKQMKATSKRMEQMADAGDTSSEKYKELEKTLESVTDELNTYQTKLKANNKAIEENKKKHDEIVKTMRVEDMTMEQLEQQAKSLTTAMKKTSKSASPEAYAKLEQRLTAVKGRMAELNGVSKNMFSIFKGGLMVLVGNLMTKGIQQFKEWITVAKQWVSTGIDMARNGEGIITFFNQLDNSPKIMQDLKAATDNTISSLKLMQMTLRAKELGVPIENMAKLMQYARNQATKLGKDVNYMADSIVDGIGRKSTLVLDNLGLSATKVQSEVKKGGDFTQAVIKIVNEELEKQGDVALTSADKAAQSAAKWENAQLKVGQKAKWLDETWDAISGHIADNIVILAGETRNATEIFDDQLEKVSDLEVNIVPLARRYDELKSKATLNSDEHAELNKIMNTISSTIPGVITEFDKYGNILSINTDKVYDYIKAEQARLEFVNKDAIQQLKKQREELQKEFEKQEFISQYGEYAITGGGGFGGGTSTLDKSAQTLQKASERVITIGKDLQGLDAELARLSGKTAEEHINSQNTILENRQKFNEMTKKQLESWLSMNEKELDKWVKSELKATNDVTEIHNDFIDKQDSYRKLAEKFSNSSVYDPFASSVESAKVSADELRKIAKKVYDQRYGTNAGLTTEETESKMLARQRKELETQLSELETTRQKELQILKETKIKEQQTDEEYRIITATKDKEYYDNRIKVLENFRKNVTDKKFLADIDKNIATVTGQKQDQDPIIDNARLSVLSKTRDREIEINELAKNVRIRQLQELELSETEYAAAIQQIDLETAQARLEILRNYNNNLVQAEINDGRLKADAVRTAGNEIVTAETETIQKRKALEKSFKDTDRKILQQYNLQTVADRKKIELAALDELHQAKKISEDTYQRAARVIEKQYEQEKLEVRQQYNIAGQQELFDMEMDQLTQQYELGLLSEEEFEKAKWQMKLKYATEFTQKINQLTSNAVNLVSALQEAETAKLEAEYAVRIAAAEGNNEEVERLENEKAQKKLDIEKKYIDAQFAIKASEIIGNTAVAIMAAWKLGWPMGPIAAALAGITGAVQLASANTERQKVKSLTLNGSSGSGSFSGAITANRYAEGGYNDAGYTGGYTGDGDQYEMKGHLPNGSIFDAGEYIIPQPVMKEPAAAPLVRQLEDMRKKYSRKNPLPDRFAEGGYNGDSSYSKSYASETDRELLEFLRDLKENGIEARTYLGMSELDAKQQAYNKENSRFSWTKN